MSPYHRRVGITRLEQARGHEFELGHLRGRWTFLSEPAGSVGVGLRRIELPAGGWSTPAHEHGSAEEIFYVLGGSGLVWEDGRTTRIAAGDCIVHLPRRGPHTLRADKGLDVLAFGPRLRDEAARFPRLDLSLLAGGAVESVPSSVDGAPIQFVREAALGPPELAEPDETRPANVVNLSDTVADVRDGRIVRRTRRNLGRAAGSVTCGVQHVEVAPGGESSPSHCHSVEEEIFVILGGGGSLVLDNEEIPVTPGHVVGRPPATRVAHMFRAGEAGLEYLAFGTRSPADLCFYPRSNKIAFSGIGVVARIERLDYWDGED